MLFRPLSNRCLLAGSQAPPRRARRHRLLLAALVALNASAAHAAGAPLSLADALRIAVDQSPQITAQRARAEGATVSIVPAGELMDPKLIVTLDNVATNTFERYTAKDYHTFLRVGIQQEFPGGSKRDLRTQLATQEARRAAVLVDLQQANIQREVANAWIARHFAAEAEAMVGQQIAEAELAIETGKVHYRTGKSTQAELLALQGAVVDLQNKRTDYAVQAKRAQIALARYIGTEADRPMGDLPDIAQVPSGVSDLVDAHELPEVRAERAKEPIASAEADLAREENWPDWMVKYSYAWRGRAGSVVQFEPGHGQEPNQTYSQNMSLEVEVSLPFFSSKRQDPMYEMKVKSLEAARDLSEKAKRRQSAEVEGMRAEWESARAQARRTREDLLPLAVQRREAAVAAYRGGTGMLVALLEARRNELAARLALIQQEQAAAKAWAWLAFAFPVAEKS